MTDTVNNCCLPDLAAECFATWGHPNQRSNPVVSVASPHAPQGTRRLDTSTHSGPTNSASSTASHNRPRRRRRHAVYPGDLTDTPTWAGRCDWLITTPTLGGPTFLTDLVGSEVHAIHRELCRIARIHPPLRLKRAAKHPCTSPPAASTTAAKPTTSSTTGPKSDAWGSWL